MEIIVMQQTINYLGEMAQKSENPKETIDQLNLMFRGAEMKALENGIQYIYINHIEENSNN